MIGLYLPMNRPLCQDCCADEWKTIEKEKDHDKEVHAEPLL